LAALTGDVTEVVVEVHLDAGHLHLVDVGTAVGAATETTVEGELEGALANVVTAFGVNPMVLQCAMQPLEDKVSAGHLRLLWADSPHENSGERSTIT
jgi:hypothetical protein